MTADAFVANAKTLLELGWHPIPLGGETGKRLLANHVTGRPGVDVTDENAFRRWADDSAANPPGLNLGSRMPVGVACIDVDCYAEKGGAETLAAKVAEWGPLPDTWSVTARSDGSRKMFFRVPEGWEGHGVAGPGIEVLQRHHRYSVAPHSIQDGVGLVRAYDPQGNDCGQLPPPNELPALPSAWVDGLRKDAPRLHGKGSAEDAEEIASSFRDGPMDAEVTEALNLVLAAIDDGAGRHDSLNDALPKLARLGAAGRDGVAVAIRTAENEFASAVDDRLSEHEARREFQSSLGGAVQLVAGERAEMDYYTGTPSVFRADGTLDPHSAFGRSMAAVFGRAEGSDGVSTSAVFKLMGPRAWAQPVPPPEFLVRGLLVRDTFGVIAGPKKSLKTHENHALALAVTTGQPLYNHAPFAVPKAGSVLYIVGEGGQGDVQRKLQRMCLTYGVDPREVAEDEQFPLHVAFGATSMTDPRFEDELKGMLDETQPDLVLIESFYNFHPEGVETGNLYQRGQAIDGFHKFVRGECAGATSLMTDHYRSTGNKGNDLDMIAMAGQAEVADSWITRYHRAEPDVENGDFRMRQVFGSRQWGGRELDVDWHLGRFDPETGSHVGGGEHGGDRIRWTVAGSSGTPAKGPANDKTAKRAEIRQIVKDNEFLLTESALAKAVGGNAGAVRELITEMLKTRTLVLEKRAATENGRTVKRDRVGIGPGFRIRVESEATPDV